MAQQIPNIFDTSGSDTNALYDWYDAGLGAGYKRFYGCACVDTTSAKYFLTTKTINGDNAKTSINVNNSNVELNFDLEFQQPTVIKGDALIQHTLQAGNNSQVYCIFTFYRVDLAAAETSIGTITTTTFTAAGATNWRRLAKVALTQTSFGVGEKLRLEIKFYSAVSGCDLYFDPSSRGTIVETLGGYTIGTDLTIDVPFRIDL